MNLNNLEKTLKDEPAFRLRQAKEMIYKNLINDWSEATNFSLDWREKLNQECPLTITAETFKSEDDSLKILLTLTDGLKVESVLMRHGDGRNTVCVSSAVGCPLGCLFCATGKMGFKRNLNAPEMVEQVLYFSRYLKKMDERVSNVVFMGMGEPFLNYDHVLEAVRILNAKDGLNIGARHISISTAGIVPGIKKLSDEPLQVNLAISLHAPNNNLRSKIMPIDKKYRIEMIMAAVDKYIEKTNRKVMFEYIMIQNVNDGDEEARELAMLINKMPKPLCFVNLIAYNATAVFKPSKPETIKRFKQILEKKDIEVAERYRFGRGIKAACGQLAS
jgi:23S rRNA (adenine2503-C2)-methyltransferase